jgi:hypothetical protein
MATLARPSPNTPVEPRHVARARRSRVFLWLAISCAAVAIIGFLPTYWLQLAPRTFNGPPLLHIHAVLCTAWVIYIVSQAWLASSGRIRSHRDWGLAGIALATAVVIVGITTAVVGLEEFLARGFGDRARSFLVNPLSAIGLFGIFTGAAIACVHRPEWHKRFMIVGTVSLIQAPAARFGFLMAQGMHPGLRPGLVGPPPPMAPLVVGLILQLILVAGMIQDKRTRGRVHPAWLIGLTVSVAVLLVKVPLSHTPAWLGFADWLTRIAA